MKKLGMSKVCEECAHNYYGWGCDNDKSFVDCCEAINDAPTIQPSLYGYKIEHLAYIAKVMEKEGVTADYAVRTFDDMSRVIKMIIGEIHQKFEEALNE